MIGDSINPKDDIQTRLSRPLGAEEFPAEMLCPSGHRVYRQIIRVVKATEEIRDVPTWACPDCVVTYRYQECTLPPGEEGHP